MQCGVKINHCSFPSSEIPSENNEVINSVSKRKIADCYDLINLSLWRMSEMECIQSIITGLQLRKSIITTPSMFSVGN